MERAAALTGSAGRPMIASGYEKAGRRWMNSLLPNVMRNVSAHRCDHFCSGGDPSRAESIGSTCDGNVIPPLRQDVWDQAYGFTSVLALQVRELSGVIRKATDVRGMSQG